MVWWTYKYGISDLYIKKQHFGYIVNIAILLVKVQEGMNTVVDYTTTPMLGIAKLIRSKKLHQTVKPGFTNQSLDLGRMYVIKH